MPILKVGQYIILCFKLIFLNEYIIFVYTDVAHIPPTLPPTTTEQTTSVPWRTTVPTSLVATTTTQQTTTPEVSNTTMVRNATTTLSDNDNVATPSTNGITITDEISSDMDASTTTELASHRETTKDPVVTESNSTTSNIHTDSTRTEADVRAPAGGKLGTEAIAGIVIVVALSVGVGIIAVVVVVIFKKHGKHVGWYSPPGEKPSDNNNTVQMTAKGIGK